ncbi:unnamed protein product, partial [Nesidiocoris tenuis]
MKVLFESIFAVSDSYLQSFPRLESYSINLLIISYLSILVIMMPFSSMLILSSAFGVGVLLKLLEARIWLNLQKSGMRVISSISHICTPQKPCCVTMPVSC